MVARDYRRPAVERKSKLSKPPPYPKKMASTSGIFKRAPLKDVYRPAPHPQKKENLEHQVDWYNDIEDHLENNAEILTKEGKAALATTFLGLTTELNQLKLQASTNQTKLATFSQAVFAPLSDTVVDTNSKNLITGISTTTRAKISLRIEHFTALLVKQEAELESAWTAYYEVQAKLISSGQDVLGHGAIACSSLSEDMDVAITNVLKEKERLGETKFKKTMELLRLETNEKIEELRKEAETVGDDYVKKLNKMDKELNALEAKEQHSFRNSLR